MTAVLVQLPERDIQDIPGGLRRLADAIEAGECGDAHSLAWVIDEGEGEISVGLLGGDPSPGTLAYYLFGRAQRRLEQVS